MINLALTPEDAAFLSDQLTNRARHVENELAHTDKRTMQSEIAHDLERLERLRNYVADELRRNGTRGVA